MLFYGFLNMKKRFFPFLLIFFLLSGLLSAEGAISDFTEEKVEEFITMRVALKSEDITVALEKISALRDKVLGELPVLAKDFEQEECILESMYFMEMYDRLLTSNGNQKELRDKMKLQMQKDIKCINERKKGAVSEWLYLFAGDVTAYYMTRSVAATLLHGMKVKGFYEASVQANDKRAAAHVCLGNWMFYAPSVLGGGKKRAKAQFDAALSCAEIKGEKYMAYIAYSQLSFENNEKAVASEYLEKLLKMDLDSLVAAIIKENVAYLRSKGKTAAPATLEFLAELTGESGDLNGNQA